MTIPLSPRALWAGVMLLVLIGVAAAAARGVFVADLAGRADFAREWVLGALRRPDPLAEQRPAEVARFDARYAAHPLATLLHVLPGGAFLLLAPLQFSTRIRNRHIWLHRWSGRILLPIGLVGGLTGLYFGILMPFGGPGEAAAIALFGGLFLAAMVRAFVAIRRGQVARHREWMIRVFAIAIAISTVRIVGAVLDIALAPLAVRPATVFVLSIWTGWIITLGAAELWIRYTRPASSPASLTHGAPFASRSRTGG